MLEIKNLSKYYDSFAALDNFSLQINSGEIIGLAGANGSGKTTLLQILGGHPKISESGGFSGEIKLNNNNYTPSSAAEAMRNNIGLIHQEFVLLPDFSVAENIFLGREEIYAVPFLPNEFTLIDHKTESDKTAELLNDFGLQVSPQTPGSGLSIALRQFVEIIRVVSTPGLKVLLLDEPTAALNGKEAEILLKHIREFTKRGGIAIFVSHRLDELLTVSDRIIVLKDGKTCAEFNRSAFDRKKIIKEMSGKIDLFKKNCSLSPNQNTVLNFKNISSNNPGEVLNNFNLDVKQASITGLAAYSGHGRQTLGKALSGQLSSAGSIIYQEQEYSPGQLEQLVKKGLFYLSEDRLNIGLLPEKSIWENMLFSAITVNKKYCNFLGIPDLKECKKIAVEYVEKLNIKCSSINQPVKELSGGNQQKVCLARALIMEPKLLFINEPTRGIDLASKEIILKLLKEINETSGTTILISSPEIEELHRICSRIAVLYEGSIVLNKSTDTSIDDFLLAMSGV